MIIGLVMELLLTGEYNSVLRISWNSFLFALWEKLIFILFFSLSFNIKARKYEQLIMLLMD